MRSCVWLVAFSLPITVSAAQEEQAQQATPALKQFDTSDKNGDGRVTRSEVENTNRFDRLLRRLDRNQDGVLQRSEVIAASRRGRRDFDGLRMPELPPLRMHLDLPYAELDGVDPNLLSLDLYVPDQKLEDTPHPVAIMIHGGGWRNGDKANPTIVGAKMRHFVRRGYIYASINYRLSARTPGENDIQHPVHAEDCAKAIAWIHNHIAEYGGDPNRLHLMGHSAGGHLAGILGANERFLEAEGKDLSILKSNVLLDPAAIDIPRHVQLVNGRGITGLYKIAFGSDEENWRDASPQLHVADGKSIPPCLIFYAGARMNLDVLGPALAKALSAAGSPSQAVDTISLDHGQINSHIGMIDEPMTKLIMRLHAGEDASKFPAKLEQPEQETNQ